MNIAVQKNEILLPWRDSEFRANPYAWYKRLQTEAPLYKDPLSENTFVLSKFSDVMEFTQHPAMSMQAPDWVPPSPWDIFIDSVNVVDPPVQVEYRRKSNKWFTPKKSAEWTQATADAVKEILDDIGPSGMVEAYHSLALIPAHKAMCKALGVPSDGFDVASVWMHDAMSALGAIVTPEEEKRCLAAFGYLSDRVRHYIRCLETSPNEGLISHWIEDLKSGNMTMQQLFEGMMLFWATATPNAAYLIAGGLEMFARYPDVFTMWQEQPEKREAIFAEITRLHVSELSYVRFTKEEVVIHGQTLPVGTRIRFMVAAANRDPDVFDHPDQFDVNRPPEQRKNLSFGVGAHICPGQMLTKAEAFAIYNTLAERVERIELASDPIYKHNDRHADIDRLPLRLIFK